MSDKSYQLVPFPKIRRLMVDGGRMARQKHLIHGLVEIDVTDARRVIHKHKAKTGETLSFTAFIMACLGRAVEMNKHMQAYRTWRERLVLFDDVDVNTMFEVEVDGRKIIRPHIIREVNKKNLRELHEEIREFQSKHEHGREANFIDWFVLLPAFIRRFLLGILFRNPHWLKDMNGTVSLTAVGMFGNGGGWGIPVSNHTLQITLGGISEKPVLKNGQLENREFLCVTISIDHDIVDGAPAARFIQRLKELIESNYGISEFVEKA
ncbi:MAG: 2-oxo acid dehydrogenase subunit E2 [Anaerolineales bacterium]|nr:2-oxo acid dehydrogenase subunit E2 [Anaerolineales bacterium]